MINVLADRYLYNLRLHVPDNINLGCYDPSGGLPSDLTDTHALLVRTVNDLNQHTMPNIPSSLTFVGTASAGSDHVDIDYLQQHGVTFTNAAGCNARSVAEYVVTALLLWSEDRGTNLTELSVGVIGVGHVGTEVTALLAKLNIPCVTYDPPREKRDPDFRSASLEEVLNCDILTFHTPLTRQGQFPTHHWLDEQKLSQHNNFELVLNTSRGGVVDESALLQATERGDVGDIIIDTWEDEPQFRLHTAERAFLKTPHIAGYSEQAKDNATKMVVHAMLRHFDLQEKAENGNHKSRILTKRIDLFDSLSELLTELHPIRTYEAKLKEIITQHPRERGRLFNKLRAEFPLRQEFAHTYLPTSYFERFPILKTLGFAEKS